MMQEDEARSVFSSIPGVDFHKHSLGGDTLVVTVHDNQVGRLMGAIRRNNVEHTSKKRLGDTVTVAIPIEANKGLGELFSS